tara:strand:+ start:200 stop:697 length:498 start_codon:yes stop_codon:yes gene_type:complete
MKNYYLGTFFAILFTVLSMKNSVAQNYDTAIGLRFGYPLSASVKHFISETSALEGYIGYRSFSTYSWTNISGAYLNHKSFEKSDGLQWYYGVGGAAFLWSYQDNYFGEFTGGASLGVQGYLGLDYHFKDIPLNLSLDWIPTIFIDGFSKGFTGDYGSIAARYILN